MAMMAGRGGGGMMPGAQFGLQPQVLLLMIYVYIIAPIALSIHSFSYSVSHTFFYLLLNIVTSFIIISRDRHIRHLYLLHIVLRALILY